jgi:pyruvate/2-oxoglutarate dehydrogenase complex dihydrolipoamide acyltransferase (E2) component
MPVQTDTTITMPQLGESVTEGTIIGWLKQVGDQIKKYDPLVEVETDKATGEVPSPCSGVMAEIMIEPGTTVPVGTPLCRVEIAYAAPADTEPHTETYADNGHNSSHAPAGGIVTEGQIAEESHLLRSRSSPVVRRLAEEHGIDISSGDGRRACNTSSRSTRRDHSRFTHAPAHRRQHG